MRDYSYLLVFVGFAVVLDIAFLIWGHRRGRRDASTTTESNGSAQIAIPFEGERRVNTPERRQHATAG